MEEKNITTYEDYKKAYLELIEKCIGKPEIELIELNKKMDELEIKYPEFDSQFREWLLNII